MITHVVPANHIVHYDWPIPYPHSMNGHTYCIVLADHTVHLGWPIPHPHSMSNHTYDTCQSHYYYSWPVL